MRINARPELWIHAKSQAVANQGVDTELRLGVGLARVTEVRCSGAGFVGNCENITGVDDGWIVRGTGYAIRRGDAATVGAVVHAEAGIGITTQQVRAECVVANADVFGVNREAAVALADHKHGAQQLAFIAGDQLTPDQWHIDAHAAVILPTDQLTLGIDQRDRGADACDILDRIKPLPWGVAAVVGCDLPLDLVLIQPGGFQGPWLEERRNDREADRQQVGDQ